MKGKFLAIWMLASCAWIKATTEKALPIDESGRTSQQNQQSLDHHNLRRALSDSNEEHRPIMYTYFTRLTPNDGTTISAGMSIGAHDLMMDVWQESWRQAGWRTKILTIDDAKQHPEFNYFHEKIQRFKTNEYNKACYYRWLAMAAVGGGWMSDYDVLPLHDFVHEGINLPMQGVFTSYARHVPCLLSGTANEWNRMTKRLVEYATSNLESHGGGTPSDMLALLGLQEKYPYIFVSKKNMAPNKAFLIETTWNRVHCDSRTPLSARGIHFAHNIMTHIWIARHPGDTMEDRPAIAKRWLQAWLAQCGRLTFNDT